MLGLGVGRGLKARIFGLDLETQDLGLGQDLGLAALDLDTQGLGLVPGGLVTIIDIHM